MKLTEDGRRELHDEIMSAIRDRIFTSEFAQDVEECVMDYTIDEDASEDERDEWSNIVREEMEKIIDNVLKRLQTRQSKR